jgi:hypothetical protein
MVAAAVTGCPGSKLQTFNNIAELAAFDVAAAAATGCASRGMIAYVKSVGDYFSLLPFSSFLDPTTQPTMFPYSGTHTDAVPANGTIAPYPLMYWLRLRLSREWSAQQTWWVNADYGYDENDGKTPETALRTIDELTLRLLSRPDGLEGDYVVNVTSQVTSSVQAKLGVNVKFASGSIKFEGYRTYGGGGPGYGITALDPWQYGRHVYISQIGYADYGATGSIAYGYQARGDGGSILMIPMISSSYDAYNIEPPFKKPQCIFVEPKFEGSQPMFFGWFMEEVYDNTYASATSFKYMITPFPREGDTNSQYARAGLHMWPDAQPGAGGPYAGPYAPMWPTDWGTGTQLKVYNVDFAKINTSEVSVEGAGTCVFHSLDVGIAGELEFFNNKIAPDMTVTGDEASRLIFTKCNVFNTLGKLIIQGGPITFNASLLTAVPYTENYPEGFGANPGPPMGKGWFYCSDKSPIVIFQDARVGFSLSGITGTDQGQFMPKLEGIPLPNNVYMKDSLLEVDDSSLFNVNFSMERSKLSLGAKADAGMPRPSAWHKTDTSGHPDDAGCPAAVTGCVFSMDGDSIVDVGSLIDGDTVMDGANNGIYTLNPWFTRIDRLGYPKSVFELRNQNSTIYTPYSTPSYSPAPPPTGSIILDYITEGSMPQERQWYDTPIVDTLTGTRIVPGILPWTVLTGSGAWAASPNGKGPMPMPKQIPGPW